MSKYAQYNTIILNNISTKTSKIIELLPNNLNKQGIRRHIIRLKKKNSSKFENNTKIKTTTMSIANPKTFLEKSVLVIADLHAPFTLDTYLKHCIHTRNKFKCKYVIFIGDLIDNSASSYHELDPNGFSASQELNLAIEQLRDWYKAFPDAVVLTGNHDVIPNRKAKTAGLDRRWIKEHKEVLQVPNWIFKDKHIQDNILYVHGHKHKEAYIECLRQQMPVVSGHRHTKCYAKYQSRNLWGLQVGIGFDKYKYAFEYAGASTEDCIENVGVVYDRVPILQPLYR